VFGFRKRRAVERVGFTLYAQAVLAARDPVFYEELAVADTLDGRFDMICLLVALLTRRLSANHPDLAQAVFDAMFTDMDGCLRESGVGDLGVPRRVKAMWEAYHGRSRAYRRALDQDDLAALSEALLRNIWRGQDDARRQAGALAGWVMRQSACLASQADTDLSRGTVRFLAAPARQEQAGAQR
jgi:cytochrome b pre-mRNA-processing protein 3